MYPEHPIAGFTATILVLIPLPRQIRARNIATIAMIFWLFQYCLVVSINAFIWDGNVLNSAPVWCDITIKLRDGAVIALPAAALCVCKHLEFISSGRLVNSKSLQSHRKIFELAMCFGVPCIFMFVSYCLQAFRFIIAENFGCYSKPFTSYVAVFILFFLPILLSLAAFLYGCAALYHLVRNQRMNAKSLSPHLKSRNAGLSSAQYYRLMALSMLLGIWATVWTFLAMKYFLQLGSSPLPTWKLIHQDISTVVELPTIVLGSTGLMYFRLLWWGVPGAAFLFFLLFGTSLEVISEYYKFGVWLKTKVPRQKPPERFWLEMPTRHSDSSSRLPIAIHTTVWHDDLESKPATSLSQPVQSRMKIPL